VFVGTFAVISLARSSSNLDPTQAAQPVAPKPVEGAAATIDVRPSAPAWVDDERASAGQTLLRPALRGGHLTRVMSAGLHLETTVLVTITTARAAVIDETW
jgi:hypothetical protein